MANDDQQVRQSSAFQSDAPDDEIDLREIYDLLAAGRWTIVAFTLGFLLLGVLYLLHATPIYDVNGMIQVVETDNSAGLSNTLDTIGSLLGGVPSKAEAEIPIIRSRLVLENVIHRLDLQIQAEPHYFPLIGRAVARWSGNAKQPVAAPPFMRKYAWGGESIHVARFEVPKYWDDHPWTLEATSVRGYTLVDPNGEQVLKGEVGKLATGESQYGEVTLLVSQLKARPGETFNITRWAIQTVLKEVQLHLDVSEIGGSGTKSTGNIQITYTGANRDRITQIVDAIETAYLQQNIKQQSNKAQQSLAFLESQMPALETKVEQAQAKLAKYQQFNGAVDVMAQTKLVLKNSVDLEKERRELIQKREQALQFFTAANPAVQTLDRELAAVGADQSKLEQEIHALPRAQQDVLNLTRDVKVSSEIYSAMLNAVQQFQVAKAGTVGNVRIVDKALAPLDPSKPKKALSLALAILLGGFVGVACVFLRRMLLRGVDDPTVIKRHLGISVIASIPYAKEQRQLYAAITRAQPGVHLLALQDQTHPAIESLRSLRTSLHFSKLEAADNRILMTGPVPGVGKSFISANFAAILAATGQRVVLVDADLRKGHLNQYLGRAAQPGVNEYVAGDVPLAGIIQTGVVAGLDLVARGQHPPNASELLMHDRFTRLLDELSAAYDLVIIDAPPVLAVTDAAIIGKHVSTTLLLLKSAEHPLREIEESIERLATAGVNVRGIVMNQVGAKAGAYGYGNYGYSYYRYQR